MNRERLKALIQSLCDDAEMREADLAYESAEASESSRLRTGSYYTPKDVSHFFWMQYFHAMKVNAPEINDFLSRSAFIEPAVGAGALFFGLLDYLFKHTEVDIGILEDVPFWLFDINLRALAYVRSGVERIKAECDVSLKVNFLHKNFLYHPIPTTRGRSPVLFGNPPFTRNEPGSKNKNAFADFTDKCLTAITQGGSLSLITPLAICFSRDYSHLRSRMRSTRRDHYFFNFDNIPDCLFKAGKARNANSNKANSQRCSIFTVSDQLHSSIYSTGLIRWTKGQRHIVLSHVPTYYDCSGYSLDDQIPRPSSPDIVDDFAEWKSNGRLQDLTDRDGPHTLNIGSVARNFIAFRENPDSSTVSIGFSSDLLRMQALCLISSKRFYEYWRTVGDGFHVTLGNIMSFPVSEADLELSARRAAYFKRLWTNRYDYCKVKKNAGKDVISFDFSSVRT